jgi:hypothetical protein
LTFAFKRSSSLASASSEERLLISEQFSRFSKSNGQSALYC